MAIEITCQCGSAYRLDDSRAGEKFTCKVCRASMQLPYGQPRAILGQPVTDAQPATEPDTPPTPPPAATATDESPAPAEPEPPEPAVIGPSDDLGPPLDAPLTPTAPAPRVRLAHMATRPSMARVVMPSAPTPIAPPHHKLAKTPKVRRPHPPAGWWLTRLWMLAICGAFLFAPWWRVSVFGEMESVGVERSLSGWQIIRMVEDGLRHASSRPGLLALDGKGGRGLPFDANTSGTTKAALLMLAGGPCLYAFGLALALVAAIVAYRHDGSGAMWPFLLCGLALLAFMLGWHLIAAIGPAAKVLRDAEAAGVNIGVSGWTYLMFCVTLPMTLIARGRPDHALDAAIRFSHSPQLAETAIM